MWPLSEPLTVASVCVDADVEPHDSVPVSGGEFGVTEFTKQRYATLDNINPQLQLSFFHAGFPRKKPLVE